jgi:hypothetical protein
MGVRRYAWFARTRPRHRPFFHCRDITARYPYGGRKAVRSDIEAIPDLAYPQATVRTHGPLAELADAMDSKSIGTPQESPKKTAETVESNPCLRTACASEGFQDPDLRAVVAAWPHLSPHARGMILGVVKLAAAAAARE